MSNESDLELARRCAAGDESAWERFVREYRPVLYRAAHALDPAGGARELADSLYAELYGIRSASAGERRSLFHYFNGRSSLATWLRAVLVQRYIDRRRAARRLESLPDDDESGSGVGHGKAVGTRAGRTHVPQSFSTRSDLPDTDRDRYLSLVRAALTRAVALLRPRERLRLASYYVQGLTLAETGRLLGEHEATASRQIARTRGRLRSAIEGELRGAGLVAAQIQECFASIAQDPGPLDLNQIVGAGVPGQSSSDGASERG